MLQFEAIDIQHFEAVVAGGPRLVMEAIVIGVLRAFGHHHLLGRNTCGEGIGIVHGGVVFPSVGREVHRAVVDGLRRQAAAAAGDGEGGDIGTVVVRRFDSEGLRPGTPLSRCHHQQQGEECFEDVFVFHVFVFLFFFVVFFWFVIRPVGLVGMIAPVAPSTDKLPHEHANGNDADGEQED